MASFDSLSVTDRIAVLGAYDLAQEHGRLVFNRRFKAGLPLVNCFADFARIRCWLIDPTMPQPDIAEITARLTATEPSDEELFGEPVAEKVAVAA